MKTDRPSQSGFTLIEAVIVVVITGVLAGVVAVFIGNPVRGYEEAVRRAELSDDADVALRRISRDIRLALPNSLRVTSDAANFYIEFIMTSAGGRYRDVTDGGNFLSFTTGSDNDFGVLGDMPTIAAGDFIVVYNLGPGYAPADAYTGGNRALVQNVNSISKVVTLSANPFAAQSPPLPSPNNRFQVVPGGVRAVSYVCPRNISGNVTRVWNYGFQSAQPTGLNSAPLSGGSSAILAGNATCTVDYTSAATGRNGLLFIQFTLRSDGESATLFQQIHVDNSP